MLTPREPRLLRTAGVRMAAVYALLFGCSALALILFLWWATAGLLDRQLEAAIRTDAQGLSERWDEGGLPALMDTLRDRLAENVDDSAIYLLTDADMRRIVGNLERWPPAVTHPNVPEELVISRGGMRGPARVERYDLPGGDHLLVGRDARIRAKLHGLVADALLWALVLVLALGTVGALVVRNLFRRMLANVSQTAQAIAEGDLARRVRLSGRGDEFDQLAETINQMLDRIARLMDGVRQVSNAIAHDLRTPITRARARLEDAGSHAADAAELRAAIERATGDLDGVVGVFQALLRIAEIEAGARRSAFAPFELGAVLRDLAELYGAVAEEKGLSLALDAPDSLPVTGDRALIQQAVANLLDNAVKFSPRGGAVILQAEGGVLVPRAEGAMTRVTVRDHGPGIPEAERARAGERFYRGESARSTPGSGLGLALAQAVAQLHGAALILRDGEPGLCATLELPTARGIPDASGMVIAKA